MKLIISRDDIDPRTYHIYDQRKQGTGIDGQPLLVNYHVAKYSADDLSEIMGDRPFRQLSRCTDWPQPVDMYFVATELDVPEAKEVGVHFADIAPGIEEHQWQKHHPRGGDNG